MRTMLFKIIPLLFIIVGGINASGQQHDSLMHYMQLAAENNPGVLQKLYEYKAALEKVPQAGSLSDPELNVGVFLSPMELVGGNQVADIQLMQMFPWFGVLKNAKDEMSLMANARFESLRDAKLQVFYDVQRTWYELHKIKQNIRISEKNAEILKALERMALVRYKTVSSGSSSVSAPVTAPANTSTGSSGMGGMGGNTGSSSASSTPASSMQSNSMGSSSGTTSLSDLYRIQIEIGNLENTIALLGNQFNTAAARFNAYINRKATSAVSVPDTLAPEKLDVSLLAAADTMLVNNPMLSMLEYEQQSLESRRKMVTRMGYPMVGLGVNYSLINKNEMSTLPMNGKDMIMPMVKVTLPVYRKKYKAMRNEAELMKTATEESFKATANALQTEYFEAVQAFQDAERRMKLYENQSLLANKSLDIMVKSFSASGSGAALTDILTIRQQTLDYELKRIEALADYNSAVAWLKRLMARNEIK